MDGVSHEQLPEAVLIVVPVYRGEQTTRDCLQSLVDSELPANVSVLIIDDASPEPAVKAICREFAAGEGFQLVENETNRGFVASVNSGFQADTAADVILLNSDTRVANDWVARLQRCAYQQAEIGTVTPFTNNGTICSYPVFMGSSPLPQGWSVSELDALFSRCNSGQYATIPTAVGFCMYIKRACLREVGEFDVENFGHGYGEECDFSLRAAQRGWLNVIAADTFVFHEGGASFAAETQDRKRRADQVINELHPQYHAQVLQFTQSDPLRRYRRSIDTARVAKDPAQVGAIFAEHESQLQQVLEHSDALLQNLLEEQGQRQEEQRQRDELERLLEQSRQQFALTDRALTEAQACVDEKNLSIERLNGEIADLHAAIEERDEMLRAAYLQRDVVNERIAAMEQSRSWRYTALLRRHQED